MHVLHVLEASGYGTGRHLIDIVESTPGVTHSVVLPPRRKTKGEPVGSSAASHLVEAGADLHRVDMRRFPAHPMNVVAVRRLRQLATGLRPDVVHGHSSIGGGVARIAGLTLDIPVVYTPNALLPNAMTLRLERAQARLTDVLVAVSQSEAGQFERLGLVPRRGIVCIPNAIDAGAEIGPPTIDLRSTYRLGDAPVVGFIGRLATQKAPDVFIDAVALALRDVPDLHAVMLASGPKEAEIERQIAALGIGSRVHVVAHVPDAATVLPQFDALAQPSRWEGGPYVPLEAIRAGVPVVLSDCVGNRDVVVAGQSGELVPVDDPAALAEAIVRILHDRERAERMATAARERLREQFDLARFGAAHLDLWRTLSRA